MEDLRISAVEMHTGGAPFRIITAGLPKLKGNTILEKLVYVKSNLDYIRTMLLSEPRGHFDMFGVYIVPTDSPDVDLGCIFIHTGGYATMCGHGVISLGRYAVDYGYVKSRTSPETRVLLQCPCGPIEAFVQYKDGKSGAVRFNSVPSFIYQKDLEVDAPGYGKVKVDLVYGGAYYAILAGRDLGVDIEKASQHQIMLAATAVTDKLRETFTISHPENPDLAFLFGTILTDGNDSYSETTTMSVCVFGEKQVDRSPCGSGVTSRIAQMFSRGLIKIGQSRCFRGFIGSTFTAKSVKEVKLGSRDAVVVEVTGHGHYLGTSTYTMEADDPLGKGFLIR